MTSAIGMIAICRFPGNPPAVVKVQALRAHQVLVAKSVGWGKGRRWARPVWVEATDLAREASPREAAVGMPIDPLPPRSAS